MLEILLVDKNYVMIKKLKGLIPCQELNCHVIEYADNGISGFEKYRIYRPRLVITAVDLPLIDGLEMVRRIRGIDPQTHIIAYTENETIEQVKQALALNVDAFINTSDINEPRIHQIMHEIRQKIWDANVKRQYIFEKLILDMLHQRPILDDCGNPLDFAPDRVLEERLRRKYYFFYLERVLPIPYIGIQNDFDNTAGELQVFEAVQKLFEWHKAWNLRMDTPFRIRANRYMFLVRMVSPMSVYAMEGNYRRFLQEVQSVIREKLGLEFTVLAFREPMTIRENFEKYHQLPHQFYYIYWQQQPSILYFDERYPMSVEDYGFDSGKIAWLIQNNDPSVLEYIDDIFAAPLRKREYASFMLLFQKLLNYLDSCYDMHLLSGLEGNRSCQRTVYDLVAMVKEMVQRFLSSRHELGREYSPKIRKVMEIIHERYREPELSIDDIADSVGYSSNHLNTLFKKETGSTIMACVNEYRVAQAKGMLAAGNDRLADIAQAVGFHTTAYFTKVFRKYTGQSPAQYRQQ